MDNKLELENQKKRKCKRNILIDLRKILNIYSEAEKIDIKTKRRIKLSFIYENSLEFGFCYLIVSFGYTDEYSEAILTELHEETKEKSYLDHWYLTPKYCWSIGGKLDVNEHALQPRINHLKKTIARLEQELNIKSKDHEKTH